MASNSIIRHRQTAPERSRGFVMIVVLIFLVVLTLIGVAGINTARVQEQIASARFERVTAAAAAQAGLSDGRDYVLQPEFDWTSGSYRVRDLPTAGLIGTDGEGWTVASWVRSNTDWYSGPWALQFGDGSGDAYALARVNRNPAFIVDRLPVEQSQNAIPYQVFRITARGEGARPESSVYTQGIVRMPVPN